MSTKAFFTLKETRSELPATKLNTFFNTKSLFEPKSKQWLVQSQTWADSRIDLLALNLQPAANIVTIASGACHALAYLSKRPAAIHCIDENPAQLALLEIKAKAFIHLPDYDAVLNFLAKPHQKDNLKRYQRHIRANLSEQASQYWQKRNLLGRPRYYAFSGNLQNYGYNNISLRTLRLLLIQIGVRFDELHKAHNLTEQNQIFEQHILPTLRNKFFLFLIQQDFVLKQLGFSRNQIEKLRNANQDALSEILVKRLRRLFCDFNFHENYFAQQAIGQPYLANEQESLPLHLQKTVFQALRQYAHRIHPHRENLLQFLKKQKDKSVDAFVLQDHLDYLNPHAIQDLWREIDRCASHGAKVLIRSLGAQFPLPQIVFKTTLAKWKTDSMYNQYLQNQDRSSLYGSLFVLENIN
ncbi:DUF3419 family protein [Undibacterium fentianense]|uniref:DUF3419 family protein n=1 Tax=Undibacterium fentianense TaxID=2828728 RepID=A0A941E1D1_9BURK|nr:DUF3419 family protein [Undibacterium fentianense]MBR7800605.1 DUF3419 family protein [Undibacterium fentianense]